MAANLAFAGCGGCDETSGRGTSNTTSRADAGDADASDADEDDAADTGDQPCTDGETRECGTNEGICETGTQTCTDGTWGACEGEVKSEPETCDGVDNDCDGEVDEDPEQTLCNDGIKCNGAETCQAGTCVDAEPVDCTHLDNPCYEGVCLEKDGSCSQQMKPDGTTCNDGNFCTVDGVCQQGTCETQPRDCSGAGDQCNTGVCDEDADACVPQPVSDGTTCDDGAFCTASDTCQAGTCTGTQRDCSGAGDQCNDGICDENADACVPQPIADGTSCDDGQYCTVGDTCQQGQCAAGASRQCGAAGGSCRTGVCDEQADTCTGDPVPDGTSCDDGQFCTVSDACQAGSCVAGGQKDCSGAGDQCNSGVCNESNNRCEAAPKPDGTTCDDGAFCTVSDTCSSGTCGGSSRDCSAAGDQCNDGMCDEQADSCVPQPISDGTTCDDGAFCTVSDTCTSGSCGGSARACAWAGDQCNNGVCDENAGACVPQPVQDGSSCDDGSFCTVSDACTAGSCGGAQRDCSAAGDQCNDGVCDEGADSCVAQAVADGTTCDDGTFCTVSDACASGVCDGAARDCSAAGDQCNDGVCDEQAQSCVQAPKADGTACDDGQFCTENDYCSSGSCTGNTTDCSAYDTQCGIGVCDESQNMCYSDATAADGTACDDGDACTANDSCSSGTCVSSPSTPVADAGPDQSAIPPNTTVQLDGSGSSDPHGQALTYSWSFNSRPSGSSASFSDPTAESPTFLADLAGTYEACLTVTDSDGCTAATDCMTVTVEPDKDLHIELVWFDDTSDADLHLRAPNGTYWNMDKNRCANSSQGTDCFFCVKNPDWGFGGEGFADGIAANDPDLDVDNTDGYGPENINMGTLFDTAAPMRVGVHYWADKGAGPISARVRIYVAGILQFEDTKTLSCDDFWEVADIEVSNSGTTVSITNVGGNPQADGRGQCP